MQLDHQYTGKKKTIWYLVLDNGESPTKKFMEQLKVDNEISHKAMVRRMINHADIGSTVIPKHGHPIRGHDNLFVWKTRQGARLLYFQLPNSECVVAHGYYKGAREAVEYRRAENLRNAYLLEEKHDV